MVEGTVVSGICSGRRKHPCRIILMRRTRLKTSKFIGVDRKAFTLQPIESGADIGLEFFAFTPPARFTSDLPHNAAHGLAAGQKKGVDDRREGLGHPDRSPGGGATPLVWVRLPLHSQVRRGRRPEGIAGRNIEAADRDLARVR